jgi:DNA-directed RNA polymerase II subunit RPB1
MANLSFAHSSAKLRTIKEIQFGLFSKEEIDRAGIITVEYPETMVSVVSWFPAKPCEL